MHIDQLSQQPARSHCNGAVLGYLFASAAVAFFASVAGMLGWAFAGLGGAGNAGIGFPISTICIAFIVNLGLAFMSGKLFNDVGFPAHKPCAIGLAVFGTMMGPIAYVLMIQLTSMLPQ